MPAIRDLKEHEHPHSIPINALKAVARRHEAQAHFLPDELKHVATALLLTEYVIANRLSPVTPCEIASETSRAVFENIPLAGMMRGYLNVFHDAQGLRG